MKYTIWRGCERLSILPPGIKKDWDDNDVWAQAQIISYEQLRSYEDQEQEVRMLKILGAGHVK